MLISTGPCDRILCKQLYILIVLIFILFKKEGIGHDKKRRKKDNH